MKIAVLGGGVGGLSVAILLKQQGFEVELYERHSQLAEIGAGIVCWPNASFVLEQLGLLEQVAKVSGNITHMSRFTSEGEALGSLDIRELNQLMHYDSYAILRKDLMAILTKRALVLGIAIHYSHQVVKIADDGIHSQLTFSNGKLIKPDLVIGAEGRMNSIARAYVNGDNAPIYQGFINWIGVFESKFDIFTELAVADYWGVGERFGIVPVSKSKAYWAGGIATDRIKPLKPARYKQELNDVFSSWPGMIPEIIEQTPISQIHKIYVHDHNPIKVWHKNNVVLLGDSAHAPLPTSGQGACQALESAWHLVNCLVQHGNDISAACRHYTELRAEKTSGIIAAGRQLAQTIFNRDPEFCQQRNLASKNIDVRQAIAGMASIWRRDLPLGG